jgi:hypothetical protein
MGYGSVGWEFQGKRRYTRAHRIAWILTHGEIPKGLCVCHGCDTPPCCNPGHFFLGTLSENQRDKFVKGRAMPGHRVLTPEQVALIRTRWAGEDVRQISLAREYGVSPSLVSAIIRGKRWR